MYVLTGGHVFMLDMETTVFRSHDPKYYTTSDWLGKEKNMPYREATVFGKRHTGKPMCSDPMIQHIILPQIGLSQKQIKKCNTGGQLCLGNAIQGTNCVPIK